MEDFEQSLSDAATFAGAAKRRPATELSLGDEQTLGDRLSEHDTIVEDIELVDLEARYKVEGTLGQGGMGSVLLALDTRLDRKVAIKRILGDAARSRAAIMRFLTEAKAIASLNHPNIVQIYDYGRAKDGPFLIMEYVDGGSLADRCRQGAIPLDDAVEFACQICDGLAKAHDAGIVHRDIKPANVLLNQDGIPKLTDFGLAKAEATDYGMTMTGAVMGTPDFMPPEQRRDASEVDARSDLWSLAATVYQMVTGRSPKIIRFNDIPVALQDVLGKALEEHKDSRYQTARELRDALKTSVRSAAVAEPESIQGKCPTCGVQNESSRRFCRGCGESLEAPCLSCNKPMPMWEEICGECGAKQTPLVEERRRAMATRQADAEGLLGDFEFDQAMGIATQLRNESHPKLKPFSAWGTSFLEQIEKSRSEQTRHAVEAMAEAGKHVAEYDYLSAIYALEMVPEALRAGVLPGMRESAGAMLDRLKQVQGEASRLEASIKQRLAEKKLDEVLPDVEKLHSLWPHRGDLQKIRTQLFERQDRQARARDNAVELANRAIATFEYERALAVLSEVAPTMLSPEVIAVRERSEELVRQVRTLSEEIKDAIAAKRTDGLLGTLEQYLALKPADTEIEKLRQSLLQREAKAAQSLQAILAKADTLEQAARFDKAIKLLEAIPEGQRTSPVLARLERATQLARLRQAATGSLLKDRDSPKARSELIKRSAEYLEIAGKEGVEDPEITQQYQHLKEMRADDALQQKRFLGLVAFLGVCALTVFTWGTYTVMRSVRSSKDKGLPSMTQRQDPLLGEAITPEFITAAATPEVPPPTMARAAATAAVDKGPTPDPTPVEGNTVRNSVGMSFKRIPSGAFVMGDETGRPDETLHSVAIATSFLLQDTEVTNLHWTLVMGELNTGSADLNEPVTNVSWYDAVEFCKRLTEKHEESIAGRRYRLPMESEWEYACRANTSGKWGVSVAADDAESLIWHKGNAQRPSSRTSKANAWGLYNMNGNVAEWCLNEYRPYTSDIRSTKPSHDIGNTYCVRGGSFLSSLEECRSSYRDSELASTRRKDIGFRVVAEAVAR